MADMTTIKGRIAETIYPNGTGAITAESHQALLLEMVDNINEVKQDVLVSGQNIRPLISGESLLGDNALAVLGTRFIYELENQKLFAMIDGALQDLDSWMVNRAVHSQVAQVIEIQKEGYFQELVPLTIKNKAGLAALCWEYDGMIYEASMEDGVLAVVSKPKGDDFDAEGNYPLLHVGTADDLTGRGESVPAEFGFRASGGKSIKDGRAYIKRIKGNSVVWNQHIQGSFIGVDADVSEDSKVYNVTPTGSFPGIKKYGLTPIIGHKYIVVCFKSGGVVPLSINWGGLDVSMTNPIINPTDASKVNVSLYAYKETESFTLTKPIIIDLTKMFQAGNEPTTIEEFYARVATLGVDLYAYNEGQVIHCNTESIKSVGDNAWDEQWEVGAFYSHGGIYDTTAIRTKNFIKVLPNTEYYINRGSDTGGFIFAYDKDFQQISGWNIYGNNKSFITPVNAEYIKFCTGTSYGTTYKNDIMVTLVHSGWKQDTDAGYQPYWQDTLPLPIIRKYFPDGMKLAGTAHDEIRFNMATNKWEKSVQRIGSVDLGTLNWNKGWYNEELKWRIYANIKDKAKGHDNLICAPYFTSNLYDAAMEMGAIVGNRSSNYIYIKDDSFSSQGVDALIASLQGVILYYELAEPIVTELDAEDQNFRDYYNVADFGTEQSQSSVPSAAFSADIIYQFNAVDMIREHELEITELQSIIATMQAQLTALTNGGQ